MTPEHERALILDDADQLSQRMGQALVRGDRACSG